MESRDNLAFEFVVNYLARKGKIKLREEKPKHRDEFVEAIEFLKKIFGTRNPLEPIELE